MINTKLQNIIDTKSAIGNAIVNKGGTITSATPFYEYAGQIDNISGGASQTIFQASDGSKWALTNAVNLTNVSNNITSDFNWWQPANNSTSTPILNVGTVGANISGNIRIVQVNQVNISQYVNLVATDTLGGKYVGYNGYDSQTNPTPTGNTTFNRWLLNNSATGNVIFANATFTTGTYNGANYSLNIANMPFVGNTVNLGGYISSMVINNGFIYAGGGNATGQNRKVQKFHQNNLVYVGETLNYGAIIDTVAIADGFIYAGGRAITGVNRGVAKYHESNLVFIQNSANYSNIIPPLIRNIVASNVGNKYIYVGGDARRVDLLRQSNLGVFGISLSYDASIYAMALNNGFLYVAGLSNSSVNRGVMKLGADNLSLIGNTVNYNGSIYAIAINNGFIYAGGFGSSAANGNSVRKYDESNLQYVGNTIDYGDAILSISINDGFIYVSGSQQTVKKYYENNLAFVGNTASYGGSINSVKINNNHIYAGGQGINIIQKFQEFNGVNDTQTFYNITKIKE